MTFRYRSTLGQYRYIAMDATGKELGLVRKVMVSEWGLPPVWKWEAAHIGQYAIATTFHTRREATQALIDNAR